MTVSTEISSNEYTGNGVTTDFDYKFRIFKDNQLSVITSDADGDNVVTLRLGTDYTVTGANKSAGGKVILTRSLADKHKISIARDIPITQETSFRNQSKFFAETHENAFDYLTMILQSIWGSLGSLYLKRPNILANWFDAKGYRIANLGKPKRDSDAVDLGTLNDEIGGVNSTILKREKRVLRVDDMDIAALPKASERAGNVLTFDKDGKPIAVAPATGSAVDVLNQLACGDGSLIGVGNQTLKDKIAEIKTVTDYGVLGDGSDESVKMQLAIDSGIVRIPDNLSVSFSDVTIHKGTEFHFGINSALISTKKDAIKFERNKEFALSGSYVKNTTTVNSNIIINEQYEFAHIIRRFDSSDAWYIANAKNPDELGFQGLVLKVKSISGSSIELESPIPFDLPEGCTVNLYNQKDTHFFGGKIINADSGSTYLYNSNRCSDIYFHRTVFDFSGNGGCRHDVSANIHFNKVTLKNRKGNGSIFLGYGSDLSTVTDSIFLGGKGGDAQLIAFAGTRNVISQRNTFLTEIDSSASIGLYFGGKTVACRSIDDKFTGGKYGFYSAYGAQGFEVIRPVCSGQNLASVFCQDSQRFSILNATSNIKVARGNTVGCIVLRSCDEYTVKNDSRTLNADGGFIFSAYNNNTELDRESKKANISVMGFGDVNINTPLNDFKIRHCDVDGALTSYYQNGLSRNGVISGNEFTKSMTLHSMRFCDLTENIVDGNAGDYAVRFTGASIFCRARRNKLKNAKYAFSLPDSQQQYFSIALYQDNEIDASVQEFVNKKVTGGTKPVMGVISNADLPPKNFFLPVTNLWDTDLTTSVSGYRHTGKNTGTANDWIKVNTTESI